jgi:hypothetical protein
VRGTGCPIPNFMASPRIFAAILAAEGRQRHDRTSK